MDFSLGRRWARENLPSVHPIALCFIASAVLVTFYNDTLWHLALSSWQGRSAVDYLFLFSVGVALTVVFTILMLIFSSARIVKYVLITLVLIAACASYFSASYGVVFDKTMIQNVFETDVHEAGDFVTSGLIWHLVLFGLVPTCLIMALPLKTYSWQKEAYIRLATIGLCLATLVVSGASFYQEYASFVRNNREMRYAINPTSPIYYMVRALTPAPQGTNEEFHQVANLVEHKHRVGHRPTVLVFVLGETARADRFSLNGYGRETNPRLAALPIVNFTNASSCGTSTAVSVPCLFSAQSQSDFTGDNAGSTENLLDVLVRADFDVIWLENNSGCKGVCARVPAEVMSSVASSSLCASGECRDEALVERLAERLKTIEKDTVIVLHQMGSHGPAYYKRYPEAFRKFTPTCETTQLQLCSREEISNAYDNTILYTDNVLAEVIKTLGDASNHLDTSMLYVSDHGESLGEMGMYLHGMPYAISPAVQREVPLVFWSAPSFAQTSALDLTCMEGETARDLSHDNIFHSVLGLLRVKTDAYDASMDLFKPCAGTAPDNPVTASLPLSVRAE
ncbi:MAG: phosphoethanolamine--lipid A transferase [Parvibaculum sp.]